MIISLEQIKASRALLKWTQKDLARNAKLNDDQVHNFEAGRSRSLGVLDAIHKTFIAHGLDFPSGGVIKTQISSYTLDSYMDLLEDICIDMPSGGEVLKHCVDDNRSTPEIVDKVSQMQKLGIRERLTISESNNYITGNPSDYRQIPSNYCSNSEVVIIYKNKIAFFIEGKVFVILSQNLASVFKNQFEYWWKEGKVINGA